MLLGFVTAKRTARGEAPASRLSDMRGVGAILGLVASLAALGVVGTDPADTRFGTLYIFEAIFAEVLETTEIGPSVARCEKRQRDCE